MSEDRRVTPDINTLLQLLRDGASKQAEPVRIHKAGDVSVVRRISSEVAALTGVNRLGPDVGEMMGTLLTRMEGLTPGVRFHEVGTVQHIGSGVARLSGLPQTRTNELVTFPTGVQGMALNLDRNGVDVILLGPSEGIQGGDLVTSTGQRLRVSVGHNVLGRVLDPLTTPMDGKGPIEAAEAWYLEREAPGIIERTPVEEPLVTGWKMIDALVPIGRGQRELILGDRQTGKTTLVVDTILNQEELGVLCFYVAIGQKRSSTLSVIETLRAHGAMDYTTVVVAGPDDPPALRYLVPYAACSMAEFFMLEGRDVLIVYDDLTKHADAYRELSLLLRRPPGREAYPGDVFYLHSRLLERACKLNEAAGGGSLTALPLAETQQGNLAAYIPTNLISITDGQIILDTDLFNQGIKPAIDVGRSVSRVGGAAQIPPIRELAASLRLELAQYEEVRRFARFGTEVDETTQQQIRRGERWRRVLTQSPHAPLSQGEQVLILRAASEGYLDDVPLEDIRSFERAFLAHFTTEHPQLMSQVDRMGETFEEFGDVFARAIADFRAAWFRESVEQS
ncbi:MAG: F0F1 ATP synthase subunit alpha [Anaerolineae bacterium]